MGSHDYIARLHDGIGHDEPQQIAAEAAPRLGGVGKIASEKQKCRHVERIHKLLGNGVHVAEICQMKNYHQHDKHTFKEVELVNTLAFGCHNYVCYFY